MKFNLFILILFIFLFAFSMVFTKESNFSIELIPSIGPIIQRGSFFGIPNKSCCIKFTNGYGFEYSLGVNGQLKIKKVNKSNLNKIGFHPIVQFSYVSNSGIFEKEEYFANFIHQNNVYQAISRHSFASRLHFVEFILGNEFENLSFLPQLGFRVGLSISLPIFSEYHQKEELIAPAIALFENGTKIRGEIESKIPEVLPQFNLYASIRYRALKYDNFEVSPLISFQYPITRVSKDIDWKIYRLNLSFALKYIIPQPKHPSPLLPPYPDFSNPPLPPETKPILYDIHLSINEKEFKDGDTIEISRKLNKFFVREYIPSVLYFARNDFSLVIDNIEISPSTKQQQETNHKVLTSVVNYLKQNPDIKVKIISSRVDDEIVNVANLRLIQVLEFLSQSKIETTNILTEEKVYKKNNFSYPELADEYRKVEFLFDESSKIIAEQKIVRVDTIFEQTSFKIEPKIIAPQQIPINIEGQLNLGEIQLPLSNSPIHHLIDSETCQKMPLNIKIESYAKSNSIEFKPSKLTKEFHLFCKDSIFAFEMPSKEESNLKFYLVGLCNFDQSEFYWVNPNIKNILDSLLKSGKKVSIAGSVDSFGSEEYNRNLSFRRARNAQQILKSNLPIVAKTISISNFTKIHQRMFRRSAWLVVED